MAVAATEWLLLLFLSCLFLAIFFLLLAQLTLVAFCQCDECVCNWVLCLFVMGCLFFVSMFRTFGCCLFVLTKRPVALFRPTSGGSQQATDCHLSHLAR